MCVCARVHEYYCKETELQKRPDKEEKNNDETKNQTVNNKHSNTQINAYKYSIGSQFGALMKCERMTKISLCFSIHFVTFDLILIVLMVDLCVKVCANRNVFLTTLNELYWCNTAITRD